MKNKTFFIFFILLTFLFTQKGYSQTLTDLMIIKPENRAEDLIQSYAILVSELSKSQVYFKLTTGTTITNIDSVTLLKNKTIFYIKTETQGQGVSYLFIPIENISEVGST